MSDQSTGPPPAEESKGEQEPKHDDDKGEALTADDKRALERAVEEGRKEREKLQKALDSARREKMSEDERAIAEAEQRGYEKATGELRREMLAADVRGLAGSKLADPADAVRLLDLDALLGDDGRYERDAIGEAIDELVKAKPYLARAPQNGSAPRVPAGARETPQASAGDDFIRRLVRESH